MKIDSVLLFESKFVNSLYPFSVLHSQWEVRCGALRIFEKVQSQFPKARIIYSGREDHLNSFFARFKPSDQDIRKENTLVLNASVLPDKDFWDEIEKKYHEFVAENGTETSLMFVHDYKPVAAFFPASEIINPIDFDKQFLPKLLSDYKNLINYVEIDKPKIINFLWDALEYNEHAIIDDFRYFKKTTEENFDYPGVNFLNLENIKIGENCRIAPGVVIDAIEGPIIIGNNVKIMANAVIIGPCFIGDNSTVKIGAKIYEKNSIGEWCKVGGEVENSIIHAYSNKQHEGFLGHSYIGEWVNLGADTNNSDLKNTYGEITVQINNEEFNTGKMFLGLFCGDHTKTAINTSFNTGTIAGICGIIVADGFLPKFIPPFAWRGVKGCTYYKLDKVIETARIVMGRRNKELLPEEELLIKIEFDLALMTNYRQKS